MKEKRKIGKLVGRLIKDGESIMIDGGTTTLQVAKTIRLNKNIVVVTNALNIAMEFQGSDKIETILIGGSLKRKDLILTGPLSEENLSMFQTDKVILGMSALSIEKGLFTINPLEAKVKKAMIESGGELIVVADSSKIGKPAFVFVTRIATISKLVIDNKISPADIKMLEDQGVEVLIAE